MMWEREVRGVEEKAIDGEVVSAVVNGTKGGRRAWGYD
jgi:hypothetical protein